MMMRKTAGKAPSSTMAMSPTVSRPSVTGVSSHPAGMILMLSTCSKTAIMRPTVMMASRIFPNHSKPVVMALGKRHKPKAMSRAAVTMGMRLISTMPIGKPAIRPEINTPTGMVQMPARIPLARKPRSSFSMIPRETGIVNTTVAPIMEPSTRPDSCAACGFAVICWARGQPPMSQASRVPANIAGSAPTSE